MKKLDGMSLDNVHERIEELKRLFPEAVKEGRLDYDTLMTLLGDEFDDEQEKYQFTWKGKLESLKLAQKRSSGTLRPSFEESRDWDTTGNLYIEGDNLEVLKLLQQAYLRKVKMIYIDPPYNTGNDFVYEDDFSDPIGKYKEATGQGMRANPETAGRYHSKWLSMMYPRLKIAKTLLRDDGVMFISIDDNEQANLKKICDEVFGEENFVGQFVWRRRTGAMDSTNNVSVDHEYVLCYSRSFIALKGEERTFENYANPDNDPRGPWIADNLSAAKPGGDTFYAIQDPETGNEYWPPKGRYWPYSRQTMQTKISEGRIIFPKNSTGTPLLKRFQLEAKSLTQPISTWISSTSDTIKSTNTTILRSGITAEGTKIIKELFGNKEFLYAKPLSLLLSLIKQITNANENDVILDFFSGSGTTAQAVMELNAADDGNRTFIVAQLPEPTGNVDYPNIADIGKERIRRAGDKIMAEWQERRNGKLPLDGETNTPPDIGFRVFKLDSSNLKTWDDSYVPPEQTELFQQRMESHIDAFKPERRAIDVVYEIFLKYGIALTEKLSTLEIMGKTFHVVGENGYLFICLDKGITVETVEAAIAYAPGTIIFSDQCFAGDNDITNASMVMEKAHIEFRWI